MDSKSFSSISSKDDIAQRSASAKNRELKILKKDDDL
jgi:hypothetical protein